jgi:hypothetical protein
MSQHSRRCCRKPSRARQCVPAFAVPVGDATGMPAHPPHACAPLPSLLAMLLPCMRINSMPRHTLTLALA